VSRLAGCRWFRRGWTLQELIAPKQLVFFGIDGNFIGSRLDLLYTLSDSTMGYAADAYHVVENTSMVFVGCRKWVVPITKHCLNR
jgi:hypothetical protein